jgi:hypothetical protein
MHTGPVVSRFEEIAVFQQELERQIRSSGAFVVAARPGQCSALRD